MYCTARAIPAGPPGGPSLCVAHGGGPVVVQVRRGRSECRTCVPQRDTQRPPPARQPRTPTHNHGMTAVRATHLLGGGARAMLGRAVMSCQPACQAVSPTTSRQQQRHAHGYLAPAPPSPPRASVYLGPRGLHRRVGAMGLSRRSPLCVVRDVGAVSPAMSLPALCVPGTTDMQAHHVGSSALGMHTIAALVSAT